MAKKGTTVEILPRQLSLDELADVANEEHLQCVAAKVGAVEHAIKSGEALIAAKARIREELGHGAWLPWLAANFEGSEDKAERYMKLARNSADLRNMASVDQALKALVGDAPHVANNSGNNEWYTPQQYIEAAREVLGEIDLDPASTPEANEIVGATTIYTAEDNGLDQEWRGRVWMNPPYAKDKIGDFSEKLATSFDAGMVEAAIVLVNNATETAWFRQIGNRAKAMCFPQGRVRFWNPDTDKGAPLQGQAFIYLGQEPERFISTFSEFGLVVEVRAG